MSKTKKMTQLEELASLVLNAKSNSVLIAMALGHDTVKKIEKVVGLPPLEISKIIDHFIEFGLVKTYEGRLNRFKVDRNFAKELMSDKKRPLKK